MVQWAINRSLHGSPGTDCTAHFSREEPQHQAMTYGAT